MERHCSSWVKRGRGLPEALVEVAAALAAGDVDEDAVEHHALLLVLVEAEIQKLSQKPTALRRAKRIGALKGACARVAVLCAAVAQKGNGVARRQQAQPDHRGASRRVNHMIDFARREPGCEVDMVPVGNHSTSVQPGK